MTYDFRIQIDTREQLPFTFDGYEHDKVTLPVGDYSIFHYENLITIERKSLQDLYYSFTRERVRRFENEIRQMQDYEFSAVVIESGWEEIADPAQHRPNWIAQTKPKSIVNSILSWQIQYSRTVWMPCPNRAYAQRITLKLLENFFNMKFFQDKRKEFLLQKFITIKNPPPQ
ncbi:MAG: hypothetical protein LBH59_06120 [Planctomycetaceae bacterium]|jgi:ERCC4-type nuclease|nr:hypothetical protein [Planctomycetaceae bacterium]